MADTAKGSAAARADSSTSSENPTVLRPGDRVCHKTDRAGTVVKVHVDGSASICWDGVPVQPCHERVPADLLRLADTQDAKREAVARGLQREIDKLDRFIAEHGDLPLGGSSEEPPTGEAQAKGSGPVPVPTTARVTFLRTSRVGNDGGDLLAVNAGVPAEDAIAEALDLLHFAAISLADLSAREYDVPGDLIAPAEHLISTARQILFAVQLGDAGGAGHE